MLKKFLKQMPSIVSVEGDHTDYDPSLISQDGERKTKISSAVSSLEQTALSSAVEMRNNPGEVAFFKLLNSELKKAIHFFEKVSDEVVAAQLLKPPAAVFSFIAEGSTRVRDQRGQSP